MVVGAGGFADQARKRSFVEGVSCGESARESLEALSVQEARRYADDRGRVQPSAKMGTQRHVAPELKAHGIFQEEFQIINEVPLRMVQVVVVLEVPVLEDLR